MKIEGRYRRPFTEDEKRVVDLLADVWNVFITLPIEHDDDYRDFRDAIHKAQRTVLKRGHGL